MRWTHNLVHEAADLVKARGLGDTARELGVTEDSLRGALRRAGLKPDPIEVPPAPSTKLVIPREARPPEEPVGHSVTDGAGLPRYLLCDGDSHYPIQDPYMQAAKIKLAQDLRPEVWVNVGDQYDCWLISGHAKEAERVFDGKARLQDEFDAAQPYWQEVSRIAKRVHYILGNHENRLARLIGVNLGLFGLRSLEWQALAGLPNRVQVHAYGTRLRVGAMTFEHGDRIGGRFGVANPTVWLLDKKGSRNTIFGHTHSLSITYRTLYDETGAPHSYVAINQGHGSDVSKQLYVSDPMWTHGFTVVEYFTVAGKPRFTAHPIAVVDGRFSFGGKMYDGHL